MGTIALANRVTRFSIAAVGVYALTACASKPEALEAAGDVVPAAAAAAGPSASSAVVSSLVSAVPGISPVQASLGAGALFTLAKAKLPVDKFDRLVQSVPGADALIATALKAGVPSSPTSLASLTPALSQAGISPDMVSQLIPAVGSVVGKAGGADLASSLLSVLK